jgi:uncharacterized protein
MKPTDRATTARYPGTLIGTSGSGQKSALDRRRWNAACMIEPAADPKVRAQPLLSVRGEVSRFIPPDSAELSGMIELVRETRAEALGAASEAVSAVRDALQELGGVVNDVASLRHPVRWATRRVSAEPHYNRTGAETGKSVGRAHVTIYVRDFGLLEHIEQLPFRVSGFRIPYAQWQVDSDNEAWRAVRLEAIEEAMRKGRDYATALRSRLVSVEHVADLGLLGGDPGMRVRGEAVVAMGGGASGANLDPIPQSVGAAVEARFRIAEVPLSNLR